VTGYERIIKAVRRERADRLPIDYTTTPEAHAMLKRHLAIDDDEQLLQRIGCDVRRVDGRYVGPADMTGEPGIRAAGKDFWGIIRKPVRNEFGTYYEFDYHPLAHVTTVAEVEEYDWPSLDWFDFGHLSTDIDRLNRDGRYCIVYLAGSTFETPWYMRGMSRFLMDLIEYPDIAEAISRRVTDFYRQRTMRAIEQSGGKIDLILSGSDIGTQRGMMLAPDQWRRYLKSYTAELISPFKKMGLLTMYHSCGSILPVIEDFIGMGLDILDPIQPAAAGMDPASLAEQFGDRLTFHGGIDEQHLLPHGTPDEVRAEVTRTMEILGRKGGYIVAPAHAIQPDTPPENIVALYDTVQGR